MNEAASLTIEEVAPHTTPACQTSVEVRAHLIDLMRRDLVGPHPDLDPDLAREELTEKPSRWYLTGFIAPAADAPLSSDPEGEAAAERADDDLLAHETLEDAGSAGSSSDDAEATDQPAAQRHFLPSSIGLTVLLRPEVSQIKVRVTWGDYRIKPKPHDALLLPEVEAPEGERPKP